MQTIWFVVLMASICLEGLGRKYVPSIPSSAFYFAKDVILLLGYVVFKPPASVRKTAMMLYRGFGVVWLLAAAWTFIEMFNPSHGLAVLAIIGLRAYWLWWLAPIVVATVVRGQYHRRRAIYFLAGLTVGIAVLAAIQFVSPPDSAVNLYSVVDGENVYAADMGIVYATGRARVSATFAFLSGFQDYTLLIPTLLLSFGLETSDKRLRTFALLSTLLAASVVPMSGSRAAVIIGAGVLLLTTWSAGLFFTVIGRRIMVGAIAGAILAVVAFPDAFFGVQSRFDMEDSGGRIADGLTVLPPVALYYFDYPAMGIGTGMQQNARVPLHIDTGGWESELEAQRYLIEIGPLGYCLVWIAKLGLVVALLRCYKILQRAGRRAAAGAALSYAAVMYSGNLTFDHIFQALFFIGAGFILAETMSAMETRRTMIAPDAPLVAVKA